ncbi:hypothetical protein [Desulfobacula sp.]|uniref:hypothetical protein n=1 Tax=Desulfobacula sp. TaxID=2593537 RepID=UPI002619F213|nr:hypothetical protein [Desulfobacula sp.]
MQDKRILGTIGRTLLIAKKISPSYKGDHPSALPANRNSKDAGRRRPNKDTVSVKRC